MTILRACALLPLLIGAAPFVPEGAITPVGACGPGPEGFGCWDMQGRLDPDLLQKLKGKISERDSRLPNRTARFAIYRERRTRDGQYDHPGTHETVDESETERLIPLGAQVSRFPSTFNYDLNYTAPLLKEFEVPFRNEAAYSEGPVKFGVGQTFDVKPDQFDSNPTARRTHRRPVHPTGARMWETILGLESATEQTFVFSFFTPLDERGSPIEFVDRRGRPVSAERAHQLADHLPPAGKEDLSAKVFPATFQVPKFGSISPAGWCDTNISPAAIRRLRVKLFHLVRAGSSTFPNRPGSWPNQR